MDANDSQSLADRIRERMRALGLNAFSAAKKAGLGESFVRDILRQKVKHPSAERLAKLAEALECSLSYLLGQPELIPVIDAYDQDGRPIAPLDPLPGWMPEEGKPVARLLPVLYELFTGSFRRSPDIRRELGFEAATIPLHYADRDQWFEMVRDDGAALVAPLGSLLQVAKYSDADRPLLGEGDVVIVERHLIAPDLSYYLVERSVRIIRNRYPDLGLWFFEYATDDVEYWGESDDIFRDERSDASQTGTPSEVMIRELAEIARETVGSGRPTTGDTSLEEYIKQMEQLQKMRARVVGKVLRAITPIDGWSGFNLAHPPKSGSAPK